VASPRARTWLVLTVLCTGVFLGAIDFYIVSVAVPDMLHSFPRAGITGISWVINGYTVTFTAALLPAGGLADRYGHRRVFLCGLAVFTLSALGCAVAPSAPALVVARLVEGFGGGTITPLALPLILARFPAERRGTGIGLWTATQSAAVAAGPSIGGGLVSTLGWRSVFFLQLPIGLAALAGTAWVLRGAGSEAKTGGRLPDLAGVGILTAAIGLFSLAVVESKAWGPLTWRTDVTLVAGIGLGAVFVWRTLHHPAPIIQLGLLKIGSVRRANVAMVLTGLIMFTVPFGLVLFLIGVWHYSPARAGLAVTPGPIMQAAAALAAGRVINRFGPRAAAVPGAVLLTASTLIFTLGAGPHPEYLTVVLPSILLGSAGLGLSVTSLSSVVVNAVPAAQLASGTAMTVTARAIGAVVSLSALALLLAAVHGGTHGLGAYHAAWVAMTVVAVGLVAVAATVPGRPRHQEPADAAAIPVRD
jgi:EmrB/QacA subfamily drug resistance transporter